MRQALILFALPLLAGCVTSGPVDTRIVNAAADPVPVAEQETK